MSIWQTLKFKSQSGEFKLLVTSQLCSLGKQLAYLKVEILNCEVVIPTKVMWQFNKVLCEEDLKEGTYLSNLYGQDLYNCLNKNMSLLETGK